MNRLERGIRRVADAIGRSTSPRPGSLVGAESIRALGNEGRSSSSLLGWHYRPLRSEFYEIRMLTVLESKSASRGTITCTMEHVSLSNVLELGDYTALSYCWGDTRNTESITINGFDVRVTANLGAALRQLPPRHRRIWVDAVCINQNDREERSLQIRNMRLIYSKAKTVLSWLGDADYRDAMLVKIMVEDDYLSATRLNLVPKDEERSPRLTDFFENPYWQRVWIIQEVAVATDVTILFGSVEISWVALARKLNMWRADPHLVPISRRSYSYALQLEYFRYKVSVSYEPITLLQAIRWSHESLATDPRDMIYALLGISNDGPALVPLPNYTQSLHEVLADLTIALMAADRSLDLICVRESQGHAAEPSKPSWILDLVEMWSRPAPLVSRLIFNERRHYSAKPNIERIGSFKLKVSGKFLGRIHVLSTIATTPSQGQIAGDHLVTPRYKLYGSRTGINDAIWKSLTMGAFSDLPSTEMADVFDPYRSCFSSLWTTEGKEFLKDAPLVLQWLEKNALFSFGTGTLEERAQYSDDSPSTWKFLVGQIFGSSLNTSTKQRMERFVKSMHTVLEGSMRLMMTDSDDGGYIGLVHPAASVGDEICCIEGCSVPVVLRKHVGLASIYTVVGGSYIHGVSDTRNAVEDISRRGNQLRAQSESAAMFLGNREFILA